MYYEPADGGCHHTAQRGHGVREAHQNPGVIGCQIEVVNVEPHIRTAADGYYEDVHTYGCVCIFTHIAKDHETQRTAAHPYTRTTKIT